MNYLSVCSGIEAASVAWEPLGFTPVGFSEIEKFPSAVLAHRFPNVPNLGNMLEYEKWNIQSIDLLVGGTPCQSFSVAGKRGGLSDNRGNLCLTFCTIADRYNPEWVLWENVPGVLNTPDHAFGCFLGELCGAGRALTPGEFGGRFPNSGVVSGKKRTVAWRVLDAQFYGVAQRRRRVFVLAVRGSRNFRCADALLPIGDRMPRNLEESRDERKRAAARAGRGIAETVVCDRASFNQGINARFDPYIKEDDTTPTITARGPHAVCIPIDVRNATRSLDDVTSGAGIGGIGDPCFTLTAAGKVPAVCFTPNDAGRDATTEGICPTLRAGTGGGAVIPAIAYAQDVCPAITAKWAKGSGGPAGDECQNLIVELYDNHPQDGRVSGPHAVSSTVTAKFGTGGGNVPLVAYFIRGNIIGRKPENGGNGCGVSVEISGTLTAVDRHAVSKGYMVRRLTPLECERLQGFPDDWTLLHDHKGKQCGDGVRYKALGNSMAVPVMRWIGERIKDQSVASNEFILLS